MAAKKPAEKAASNPVRVEAGTPVYEALCTLQYKGRAYGPGELVELEPADAAWLLERAAVRPAA